MRSFSLVVEYLTGYAVATDPGTRERPEWPPHPARVFMAMAAAHFETDGPTAEKAAEREALEWLGSLAPPDISIPDHAVRDVLEVYVPVNDQSDGEALVKRSRQPRVFPRVYVGDAPVRFIWRTDPQIYATYLESLRSICRHVTRIGHSSSLVWVRIEADDDVPAATHTTDSLQGEYTLRITHAGAVGRLEQAFNAKAIEEFEAIETEVAAAKGAEKKKRKAALVERFPLGKPTSQRPTFPVRMHYRQIVPTVPPTPESHFDSKLIILRESDEDQQTFGLESTGLLLNALRNLIMSKSPVQPPPPWVTGHEPGGDKLQTTGHMALIPLGFVGGPYADGHLMGLGIVFPKSVSYRDRASVLSKILFDDSNAPATLPLRGKFGTWNVVRETGVPHQQTLKADNYAKPSQVWATVTPVVLDRMPKADRQNEPALWREQTAAIIARSCVNIGLPEPISIRVEKTPFFRGSLRAMPAQGGFPLLLQGRFQVHAKITFAEPVAGPVLIGAGRFRGYGLCRPWEGDQ